MGANLVYLPRPNKKKHTLEGRANNYKFVLSSMQGWRLNMVSSLINVFNEINRKMHTYAILISIQKKRTSTSRAQGPRPQAPCRVPLLVAL
jgi:hypothetical protein